MTGLYLTLAISDHYPAGTCWAWMDAAEKVCGRPESADEPHLCTRHIRVAIRKRDKREQEDEEKRRRRQAYRVRKMPEWDEELRRIDREIARLDPPPPTRDPAAYLGEGSTAGRRYQAKYTPSRIHRLAKLHERRRELVGYGATPQEAS